MVREKESEIPNNVHSKDMPDYLIYKPYFWVCRKEDFSIDRSVFNKSIEPEWMDVDHVNNCFGIPVIDCRYNRQRKLHENPDDHWRMLVELMDYIKQGTRKITLIEPLDSIPVVCRMKYPYANPYTGLVYNAIRPGVVFMPRGLGDFWTAICTSKRIVFYNALTGRMLFNAHYQKKEEGFLLDYFDFDGNFEDGNIIMAARVLDFMIKTFMYRLIAPAPLPYAMNGDPYEILNYCFAKYGAHGCFATFYDARAISWDNLYQRNIFQ